MKKIKDLPVVHNLYMDCNSIIYDAVHSANADTALTSSIIIMNVIKKIQDYIHLLKPVKRVIIAFDGVAPLAKMKQQRVRRYKSYYQNQVKKNLFGKSTETWNTVAITPGTEFMEELTKTIKKHFSTSTTSTTSTASTNNTNNVCITAPESIQRSKKTIKKFKVVEQIVSSNSTQNSTQNPNPLTIIVTASDEQGEGEHKIFEYIRNVNHENETTLVYGLDADLIMLSINHLSFCHNIFLYRETPEFIKSINKALDTNENYYLDIPMLMSAIESDNACSTTLNTTLFPSSDYIFLCFLLGNDFLPHFPSLNIRTGGITKLLEAYQTTMLPGETLTDIVDCDEMGERTPIIYWKKVKKIVQYLASREENYIVQELKLRDKQESNFYRKLEPPNPNSCFDGADAEQKFMRFEMLPTIQRDLEKGIHVGRKGWEYRYYSLLNNTNKKTNYTSKNTPKNMSTNNNDKEDLIKKICINYLEGLEWTFHYYSHKCIDWRWSYKYNYPPLLKDLLRYIPEVPIFDSYNLNGEKLDKVLVDTKFRFISKNKHVAVHPWVQLAYVLPRENAKYLPNPIYRQLVIHPKFNQWYPTEYNFVWAFCKYFWESHIELSEINIAELEEIVTNANAQKQGQKQGQ